MKNCELPLSPAADAPLHFPAENEEAYMRMLVERHYTSLCVYAVQIVGTLEVAEDIVQDFFLRLWEDKRLRTVKYNPKSYLFNSVRNMAIDYLRKKHPYVLTELEESAWVTEEEIDEESVEQRREKLQIHLKKLSPQEYKVLMEVVVNNKRYKEVAAELRISVNTVKTHLSRALSFLRKQQLLIVLLNTIG